MAKRQSLAEMLRREIRASGLSARKLGELSGIRQQSISAYLNGGDVKTATAEKLAAALALKLELRKVGA